MLELSDQITRKFTDVIELDDEWEILTDTGWEPIVDVKQTVEYDVWQLQLENQMWLECADDHIVFTDQSEQVYVKDLTPGDMILTDTGPVAVKTIALLPRSEQMYDLEVGSDNHRFYSNGILSHNTTVAAGYLLWYAMFKPDSTILVAAHKQSGANEIMQRIRYAYESCPDHIRAGVTEYNKGSITFDNGSRIMSTTTTENTGRGMSLTLIYLDEFAFVPSRIAKEFWTSLSPTLSTGGKCIVTSTPNSDDDTFALIWAEANNQYDEHGNQLNIGRNGFKPLMAIWDQHPERDAAWAAEERSRIGDERFRREHSCEFIIYDETLVSPLKLVELQGTEPKIKTNTQIRWYQTPNPDHIYSVSLDPSAGTGGDNAAIQVMNVTTMSQAAEWCHNRTPVEGQIKIMMDILMFLRNYGCSQLYWSVENNTIGEAALVVIRDTGEEIFPGEFIHEPKRVQGKRGRKGFHTGHRSKMEACLKFKRLMENNKITIHSKPLISELKNFVRRGQSYSAKPGEGDDLVMSMMINIRMIEYIGSFEDQVYDSVNSSLGDYMADDDDYDGPMPSLI